MFDQPLAEFMDMQNKNGFPQLPQKLDLAS